MMTPEVWRERIKESVREVADRALQEGGWLAIGRYGNGEYVSSPEETYAGLFDDFAFEDFLNSKEIGLTEEQQKRGQRLLHVMDEYSAPRDENGMRDAKRMIDDPKWQKVREVAADFLEVL